MEFHPLMFVPCSAPFLLLIRGSFHTQALEAKVEKERQDAAATHAAWVRSKTPKQIMTANNARHHLKQLGVMTRSRVIHDGRIPKAATNAYVWFFRSRAKEDYLASNVHMTGITKALADEWKSMDEVARQVSLYNYSRFSISFISVAVRPGTYPFRTTLLPDWITMLIHVCFTQPFIDNANTDRERYNAQMAALE